MKRGICFLLAAIVCVGCGSPHKTEKKYQGVIEKNTDKYIELAMKSMAKANVAEAIQYLDTSIRKNPTNPEGYLLLSQIYLKAQNYTKAIDTASGLLMVHPDNGDALFLVASAYTLRNQEAGDKSMALLAAKKSAEVFMVQKNKEKFARSLALVQQLQQESSEK